MKNSLHYTGIIYLESEIRLVKDGYVIATILLDEKDKEYIWGICYFSYTKLIRMEVYTDRIIYSNSYITATSKNGLYAKLVRRTFYNCDASVAYDQVFEGERIEWHTDNGWIYRIDFYNRYGLKHASEFRDADGNVESKVLYSDNNQEVIVEQPGNDVVTLVEKGSVKGFFNSRTEFFENYAAEVSRNEKKMIFIQDEKMLDALQIKPEEKQAGTLHAFRMSILL